VTANEQLPFFQRLFSGPPAGKPISEKRAAGGVAVRPGRPLGGLLPDGAGSFPIGQLDLRADLALDFSCSPLTVLS